MTILIDTFTRIDQPWTDQIHLNYWKILLIRYKVFQGCIYKSNHFRVFCRMTWEAKKLSEHESVVWPDESFASSRSTREKMPQNMADFDKDACLSGIERHLIALNSYTAVVVFVWQKCRLANELLWWQETETDHFCFLNDHSHPFFSTIPWCSSFYWMGISYKMW